MFGGHYRNLPGRSTGWDWGEEAKAIGLTLRSILRGGRQWEGLHQDRGDCPRPNFILAIHAFP